VHEWSGSPQALQAIFQKIISINPDAEILSHRPLIEGIQEPLCLGKILNPEVKKNESQVWFWGLDSL
jgi:hypothetical protein